MEDNVGFATAINAIKMGGMSAQRAQVGNPATPRSPSEAHASSELSRAASRAIVPYCESRHCA